MPKDRRPDTKQAEPKDRRPNRKQAAPNPKSGQPPQEKQQQANPRPKSERQQIAKPDVAVDKRRELRRRIFQSRNIARVPRSRVNVSIRVGNRLPRHLRVRRFTPTLVSFVPAYASYSYIVIGDDLCIVEPDTYEIVDVIPATIIEDGPAPAIYLSSAQRRCVLNAVPRDVARVDAEFPLALNSTVPNTVELVSLPQNAVRCADPLDGYEYVVVNRRLVLVEPDDRRIVLTLQF